MVVEPSFAHSTLQSPETRIGHALFSAWLIKETSPSIFVELGTRSGDSYFAFCRSICEHKLPTKSFAVGAWLDMRSGRHGDEAFACVTAHNQKHYSAFSCLFKMNIDSAVNDFADSSIGLLHITNIHKYEEVRQIFEAWRLKLTSDAVVVFHGINLVDRDSGVRKFWDELRESYRFNLELSLANGLGVLQISDASNDTAHEWIRPDSSQRQRIKNRFEELGLCNSQSSASVEQTQNTSDLTQAAPCRAEQVASLRQAVADRDRLITCISAELAAATMSFVGIQRSRSWRLTAPLRFVNRLLHGEFKLTICCARKLLCLFKRYASNRLQDLAHRHCLVIARAIRGLSDSTSNHGSLKAIVAYRCAVTRGIISADPLRYLQQNVLEPVDISVVVFNSSRWLPGFVDSLMNVDYDRNLISITFVDNASTDSTLEELQAIAPGLENAGFKVGILQRPNLGFGAGHNSALADGHAPFCLVSNVDVQFEPDTLRRIMAIAIADQESVAAWELRQKPYEHPKYYDPVTGVTNWNSHACVLLRRSALAHVGYYDEAIFMYGEDVELSYRLRRSGFLLRYCPQVVVWHYCYEDIDTVNPIQYTGGRFAGLYLRLKYGNYADIFATPILAARLLLAQEQYQGSRVDILRALSKLSRVVIKALRERQRSNAFFPFRHFDFELAREGSFVAQRSLPSIEPLVSVITRTHAGRELYLRQALLSVAHQSYSNIEHIVIEDGGETTRAVVDNISAVSDRTIHFVKMDKLGRSAAGNAGLSKATGRWCIFLDDDDLLFSDHIEILVNTLLAHPDAVAAYSLAWEVVTDSTALAGGGYSEVLYRVPKPFFQPFDYEVLKHHNYMPIQSVLFERELYASRGGFPEDMDALEDWVLWLTYAYKNRFQYVPKVTSMYRTPACHQSMASRQDKLDRAYPIARARIPNEPR